MLLTIFGKTNAGGTMAIIRDFSTQKRDRSAQDRHRHKKLVQESLKKGIADVIAEESIIGRNKNEKIKVPIRGIKEYQFVFGSNNGKGVAQGNGSEQTGQKSKKEQQAGEQKQGGGNNEGEDLYETEITVEDAINLMFEDLELPELEQKKLKQLKAEAKRKLLGYKKKGTRNRLAKKKTVVNKLKRKIAQQKKGDSNFSFIDADLVYRKTVNKEEEHSNAVVFCIMDTSGSMDNVKKYLARSFYFLLYQFLTTRYEKTEIVFIAHHASARVVSEDQFFHKVESGGTCISTGYNKAIELIENSYPPELWNIYAFHCSDGDNFTSDDEKAIEAAIRLTQLANLFGYGEIKPESSFSWSSMIEKYDKIEAPNFVSIKIRNKEEVWPAFKQFLSNDRVK